MLRSDLPADTFGDPFALEKLPLARQAIAYAVQRLDTDCLLDRNSNNFKVIRSPGLQPGFASFAEAFDVASEWVMHHCPPPADHGLAIVPIAYDPLLERHVLIYGVLGSRP